MSTNGGEPLAGWVLAIVGGTTFVGRRSNADTLSPVFTLNVNIQVTKQGVSVNYIATPVLMLASIDSLQMPPSAVFVGCDRLTRAERKRLHSAIQTAEENVRHMRAADAGLLLANTMPVGK